VQTGQGSVGVLRVGNNGAFGYFDFQAGRREAVALEQFGDPLREVGVDQIACRYVDRNFNVESLLLPVPALADRGLDDPVSERLDGRTAFRLG
jgi:hypothetical protein